MAATQTASRPMLRAASTAERYVVYDEFAAGGMATVHLARLDGAHGFRRTVAVKRLLPHLLRDQELALMLVDEARLAARIRHHNVVATLDVVRTQDELLLVMEYVHGEPLAKLARRRTPDQEPVPLAIACAIVADALHGLHAAHEATSEQGKPLELVHRDVSPQNILVGADGAARIVDFGIAKAIGRGQTTRDNVIKGKLAYMAPEQIEGTRIDRRTDVFAAAIVLWELVTGERLFAGHNQQESVFKLLSMPIAPPSSRRSSLPPELDRIVMRGLSRDPQQRFATAEAMALALEEQLPIARPAQIARWVKSVAGSRLAARASLLEAIERAEDLEANPASSVRRRAPRRTWLLALAALVALGLASWLGMRSAGSTPLRVSTERNVPALPELASAPASPSTVSLSAPASLPVAEGGAASEQTAEPASRASPPAGSAPKRVRKRDSAVPSPAREGAAHQPSCDPPFTLDAAGRTLFKIECL